MGYPSQEEVVDADPLLEWIDEHFLRPDPFAFVEVGFRSTVSLIAKELDVDPNGIYCVGSGAIGLSFNPRKIRDGRLKPFDEASDLDIAVISELHFESAWRDLRRAAQPTLSEVDQLVAETISWQRKKFFDGAIVANKILPALSFGSAWLEAGLRVSQSIAVALDREIEINYWIYRDYWSLRNYVSGGIVTCKKGLV